MTAFYENMPTLRTDRLVMRTPNESDVPAWFERATDREPAYLAGDPIPKDISEGQTWLKRTLQKAAERERLLWSIDIRGGPVSVGTVGLSLQKPGISFVLGRSFWGRGYATEAAHEVPRFSFKVLGFSEVGSEFIVENIRSRRVHEKLCFEHVENFIDESDGAECERHILAKRTIEEQR